MSHRGDLTERTVLIPLLLAERPRSQQDLAKQLGVNRRTVKRYIDALSRFYPIIEERDGREVQYSFSDGYKYQPPSLTPTEIAPLLLAQQSIAATGLTGTGSPFHQYAESMLAKLRRSLPQSLREKLDAMSAVYGTAAVPAKDFSGHAAIIDALTNAAIDKRSLRIWYETLNTGKTRDRTVDPYAVYFDPDGATLKLIAYDHYREKILPFSVDHIRSVKQTNESFTRPADFDLREFLAENCFNGIHGDPVTVRLRALGVTARVFAERTFHRSQRLIEHTPHTAERDESTTIEMRVASGRGLVRFILSWAPDVQVLSPPKLRDDVADAHRSAFLRSI